MAVLTYPIYDTILLADNAGTYHTLFQTGQGASSTKGFTRTNMRGSGQFPDRESFTIKRIGLHINAINMSDDDVQGLFVDSIFTLTYNNVKVLQVPSYMLSDLNNVEGIKTEASASAFDYFGQSGNGYMLERPILIQGGKNISAEFYQSLAVDTANIPLYCVLYGELDTPDINVN